jgi:hypothetical protein
MKTENRTVFVFVSFLIVYVCLATPVRAADPPLFEWMWPDSTSYPASIVGTSMDQTIDGGYVLAGHKYNAATQESNFKLIKIDSTGVVEWDMTYDNVSFDEKSPAVRQTSDGGYILAGNSFPTGGDGSEDDTVIYLLKTHSNGNRDWSVRLSGNLGDWGDQYEVADVFQVDGGYVIGGSKYFSGTKPDALDASDYMFLIKTDGSGRFLWEKELVQWAEASSVIKSEDGGFILVGNHGWDGLVSKTDAEGNEVKRWTYDFQDYRDRFTAVCKTKNDDILIAGTSDDFYDETENYVLKLDLPNNIIKWKKSFPASHYVTEVLESEDRGYIFGFRSNEALDHIVKMDHDLKREWGLSFHEGTNIKTIEPTKDCGIAVFGYIRFGTGKTRLVKYEPIFPDCDVLATVTYVQGAVTISSISGPVEAGDLIREGDTIDTGDPAVIHAWLKKKWGVSFAAGSSTSFRVRPVDGDKTALELFKGRIRTKIKKLANQFEIITPVAVSSDRGTEFLSQTTDVHSTFTVLEGSVQVSTQSDMVDVDENYAVEVNDQGIGEPYLIDPESIDRWWAEQIIVSVASPVDLFVIDPYGLITGKYTDGHIYTEIPNSIYSGPATVPEEIIISKPGNGAYDANLSATGSGWYDLSILMDTGTGASVESYTDEVDAGDSTNYPVNVESLEDADCYGDCDQDGDIDGDDVVAFAIDFAADAPEGSCRGDFNQDGHVDGCDLKRFAFHFGRTNCPSSNGPS